MKFLIALFFGVAIVFTFLPSYSCVAESTKNSAIQQLNASASGAGYTHTAIDPRIMAANIIKIFLGLIGTVAIFLFVYAGYLLITSHGDSAKMGKASKIMTGAMIGILLILLSFSITNFVGKKLQQGITQDTVNN
ncbi:MAG: hypothetical protein ACD_18C00064G0004 [uncultured bacterium]|nr:MAG: hypothetical protein ACD_18C00064G0004 [uncultured bacterium]OGH83600.1 MAG: hypothetical protein A2488_03510 [Candidatus Magasanikbacteria bacterium RIFOXYC12_FULL_32_21b]OGH90656.1 MAG: hypothetical protein A2507_01845 [Candidatus Magasanikbacteria bacterium RIFOXYD12_FULL_33_17]HAO52312.1 hypothetical protein [Candidatus Magasanikbacteria bacterium]